MLRKIMLAAALIASPAFAQQNTDISGPRFLSGEGDATLAALGRQAAASGNRLVITAPADWHAKIAAKIRAGGKADVVMREGFYENVLVRVEDASAKSAATEPDRNAKAEAEKSRAEAERAKAEAEKIRAEADKAKAEADKAKAEADKAKAEAELAKARAQQQAAAAAAPVPVPAPAASQAASVAAKPAAVDDVEAIRARFEQSLLGGRGAEGTLAVDALQSGDIIYIDGPVRAVTRRDGLRAVMYWLDGDLDLRRAELKVVADNRYQVLSAIRGESGALRREFDNTPALILHEPAADAPARATLERNLNEGRPIAEALPTAKLQAGDVIYLGDGAAVVVRREGTRQSRYWLEGSLDARQPGLRADGANKYKVLSDKVR